MNAHRRGRWLLGLLIVASVVMPTSGARAGSNFTVQEIGTRFSPAQITVSVGDTITWVYVSSPPGSGHSVTFQDEDLTPGCPALVLDDCQRNSSEKVSRTFTAPGTYSYYCRVHQGQGMTGVVVVTAATTTNTTRSTTTSTVKSSTTSTSVRSTSSSTTSTTRPLATSSTVIRSSTTTLDTSSGLAPGAPPSLGGDSNSAASKKSDSGGGHDHEAVALIVGLLLAVSAGGGYLLWRLRPGRP